MDKLYIPGDLVYFGGEKAKVWFRNPSADDSIYVRVIENGGENRIWNASLKEEISPIPLTTEILEKNGWDFTGYNTDFNGTLLNICSKHDILPCLYYYYATEGFSVSICGKIVLPNIKYVHELQHLLFGLNVNHEMEV